MLEILIETINEVVAGRTLQGSGGRGAGRHYRSEIFLSLA